MANEQEFVCGCGCSQRHSDNCGCGQGEEFTVTLTLDDGEELECVVLTIFPAGDKEYIALLPVESADAEEGEVFLYRYSEGDDGQPVIENIEDDDEYEVVADAFDELLDEDEYDLIDEDELEEELLLELDGEEEDAE